MEKMIRILVVDDEIGICNSVAKTLSRAGYIIDYSLNGEEAIKKIALTNYHLVITDLRMPKIDGMQLLKTVKSRWPEVNVIMITAYGTIRSAVEAIKLGAYDYIPKPFTSEELVGVVVRALELTKMRYDGVKPAAFLPTIELSLIKLEDLKNMWCIPEHSWAKICEEGTVLVGLDAMYYRLIGGDITNLEFPDLDKTIKQGEACVRITVKQSTSSLPSGLTCHNLWSPVSGTVIDVNQEVLSNLLLIAKSPYVQGWLIRMKPSNWPEDMKNLSPFKESICGRVIEKHLIKKA